MRNEKSIVLALAAATAVKKSIERRDQGPAGPKGQKGDTGVGVADVVDAGRGNFSVVLTDGQVKNFTAPKGAQGAKGLRGDRGEVGEKGEKGDIGPMPKHQWDGSKLRFESAPGVWGSYVDLRGPRGFSRGGGGGGSYEPVQSKGAQEIYIGEPTAPPTSPALIFVPQTVGGKTFYRVRVSDGNP